MVRPELVDFTGRDAGYRYAHSKGNSIEGGTSEVLLNIVDNASSDCPPSPATTRTSPGRT
ncbi:Acyl-CoA dehydrogenase OS=Streptomyces microflavus OX=1919 GN=Smic_76010 PE=3 SV=1 [Streptomyces microflavus]